MCRVEPAATTVWRLLIRINAEVMSQVLAWWLRAGGAGGGDRTAVAVVIAVGGKAACGARLPDGRQVHLLSAYDTSTGVVQLLSSRFRARHALVQS